MSDVVNPVIYGVDESKKIAGATASVINVGYKLFKGSFLALFELVAPLGILKTVDFDILKKEILDLDPVERQNIENVFVTGLDLADKKLQKELSDSVDALNQAFDIVAKAIDIYDESVVLIDRFKKIVGA